MPRGKAVGTFLFRVCTKAQFPHDTFLVNMHFTMYGYNLVTQVYALLRDTNVGQYTTIASRSIFTVQLMGIIAVSLLPESASTFIDANGCISKIGQEGGPPGYPE